MGKEQMQVQLRMGSTMRPFGEQSHPSRQEGCIKQHSNRWHCMKEGRVRRQAQLPADEQRDSRRAAVAHPAGGTSAWGLQAAHPCHLTTIGSGAAAPAHRVYRTLREPRPNTPMTCQKRGSFDHYTYRPCMEASATFSSRKTASTALQTIVGCSGCRGQVRPDKGRRSHDAEGASHGPRRRHNMRG